MSHRSRISTTFNGDDQQEQFLLDDQGQQESSLINNMSQQQATSTLPAQNISMNSNVGTSIHQHQQPLNDNTNGAVSPDNASIEVTSINSLQNSGSNLLFDLCERVAAASHNNDIDYVDIEDMWQDILDWLNNTEEDKHRALEATGDFQTTALHLACKALDPPEDIIKLLINCRAEVAGTTDTFSWIPLHYACANGASPGVIISLLDAFSNGSATQDRRNRTPLHFLLGSSYRATIYKNSPEAFADVVRMMCENNSLKIPDENGMLPLHYACAFGMTDAVLQVLISFYPESIYVTDNRRRTAIHFVMGNPAREASPSILKLLLSLDNNDDNSAHNKVINMRNKDGHLPIHLLNVQSSRIPPSPKEPRINACQCLLIYLDANPTASADFLTVLQDLPDWLRDTAVSHSHVQHILNKKISQCFPTSILLLDGFYLVLIIVCFYFASDYSFERRYDLNYNSSDEKTGFRQDLFGLYFSVSYFILREIVQVMSLMKLGSFKSWLFDVGNLLDLLLITSVLYFTIDMQFQISFNNKYLFRTGIAVTYSIAWISVISYLKSIYIDFSVFVGGVLYVVRRLAAFLMALGIILIAFAQMFVILFRNTSRCTDTNNDEYFPHCTFVNSVLRVFIMLVGAVNMADYQTSTTATLLYVLFAFLVVILLSNVLIAVVSDSYGVIKNERASIVFWSNRLNFIAEMGEISSVFHPIIRAIRKLCKCCSNNNGQQQQPQQDSGGNSSARTTSISNKDQDDTKSSGFSEMLRSIWIKLLSIFEDEGFKITQIEFWVLNVFRVMTICIIIPLWLIIGLVTAGWLWPEQVREWLFVQKIATITSRADVEHIISKQVLDLKTDVGTLKEDLLEVMNADEKDLNEVKSEGALVKENVLNDMRLIKELLTTFLTED